MRNSTIYDQFSSADIESDRLLFLEKVVQDDDDLLLVDMLLSECLHQPEVVN